MTNKNMLWPKRKQLDDSPPFVSHMSYQEANRLSIDDKIDHRDHVGRFVYATVSEKQGTNLKIHYDGWDRKWDTWSDFTIEIDRFAHAGSISKRPSYRFAQFKKGDYVDINPRHQVWRNWTGGKICRTDQESGQVQVSYEFLGKTNLYWTHLDNVTEIAEIGSKSGTTPTTNYSKAILTLISKQQQIIPNLVLNQQQINLDCTICKSELQCNSAIQWTQCGHKYCVNCIQLLIEQLSLSNKIPKCLYTKCGESLNIQSIHQHNMFKVLYPSKYKIKISLNKYNNNNKLICGYIRVTNTNTLPNDIILLIFDYYYLNYVKRIKCDHCNEDNTINITINNTYTM
eukprot:124905_1